MEDVRITKPQKFPLFNEPNSQTPHENVFTYSEKPRSPQTLCPLWNMAPVTLNSSIITMGSTEARLTKILIQSEFSPWVYCVSVLNLLCQCIEFTVNSAFEFTVSEWIQPLSLLSHLFDAVCHFAFKFVNAQINQLNCHQKLIDLWINLSWSFRNSWARARRFHLRKSITNRREFNEILKATVSTLCCSIRNWLHFRSVVHLRYHVMCTSTYSANPFEVINLSICQFMNCLKISENRLDFNLSVQKYKLYLNYLFVCITKNHQYLRVY